MGNKFVKDMDSAWHWISEEHCSWGKAICSPAGQKELANSMGQMTQQSDMQNADTGEAFAQEGPDFFNTMNSMIQGIQAPALKVPKGYRAGGDPSDRSTYDTSLQNRLGHISGFHY